MENESWKWFIASGLRTVAASVSVALPALALSAGTLTPVGSGYAPIQLESHHVTVVINNGFARTEVEQVFYNPNTAPLEAVYATPIPERGALSELSIAVGERVLNGEVVSKDEANRVYEEEKASGNDAGKASQQSYQRFEFAVSSVPPLDRARMRYVYYEPLLLDAGVGRYTYRLEEGGTDAAAESFWTLDQGVAKDLQIDVTLKSAWPIAKTRTPSFAGVTEIVDTSTVCYRFSDNGGRLDQDFVFYYMLADDLPGRVEMLTYRESGDKPGTFMMTLTPGEDLQPLASGSDFVFVLDVSGSMQGKLHTLLAGVRKALGQLRPQDRFRIVTFSTRATELTRGWLASSPENVDAAIALIDQLAATGNTNLYEGVSLALRQLDADRVSSVILVTDGVTNEGIVEPARFYALLHGQDVRFFGFLLGNGSNWPLLQLMCDASGGYYRSVSNNDDIIGEILLAKSKVAYESLHDAVLKIRGVETFDVSDFRIGKIHYGQQLVLFGRYEGEGLATVSLDARLSGESKRYETEFAFPSIDLSHPELERLWAMDQAQKIEINRLAGYASEGEAKQAIRDLGIAYQIVTDETSMIALDDATFERRGIERRNAGRLNREAQAAAASASSVGAKRVDTSKPMFSKSAPSLGGGGAVEPWMALLVLAGALIWFGAKRSNAKTRSSAIALLCLGGLAFAAGIATVKGEEPASRVRWTDRRLQVGPSASSIDDSIASFWEVSAEEAKIETRSVKATTSKAAETVATARSDAANEHRVRQTRARHGTAGHFGINLFNAIPIIDFVWGEKRLSETDEYSGSAKR